MSKQNGISIKQEAQWSGVTVRTLHYYDQIGLLKPQVVGENGYRYYSQENLQTLQQILFFRELQFPLKEIIKIIHQPDFDRKKAMQEHRKLLILQKERLERLIQLTEEAWKGEMEMNFQPFDERKLEEYKKEAKERWGKTKAWQQSQEKEQKRGEEEGKEMQQQMEEIFERAAQLRKTDPAALPAQQLVEAWKAHITQYHYECTNEILAGLAQMYRYDERFMANLDRYGKGTACFLAEAIDCCWKEKSGC